MTDQPDTSLIATIEEHQKATATPAYLHAAALRAERWGQGRELSRAAYSQAIERVRHRGTCGDDR